jgi:protease stability complex PrcB-like protein
MNNHKKNTSPRSRPFPLLLALTLFAYPLLQCPTVSEAFAARKPRIRAEHARANTPRVQDAYLQPGGIKVLAEGYFSKITKPFVAVVRDVETYAALRKRDDNLPGLDAEFFKANVVLAAFLGERNTGGYRVEITPSLIDINIFEKKPGKDIMVTEMITSPFKIVALPGMANAAVRLTLDEAWRQATTPYRVTSGTFRMAGGFAGTSEEFGLEGVVNVMGEGKLATIWLRIVSSGGTKRRLLMECATGLMDGNNINVSRMSADSLVSQPNGGLVATAMFSEKGRKFTLSLMSGPSLIADGYSGGGTIEAELGAPATKP